MLTLTREIGHKDDVEQLRAVVKGVLNVGQLGAPVGQVHQQGHHPRCGPEGAPVRGHHVHPWVHRPATDSLHQ